MYVRWDEAAAAPVAAAAVDRNGNRTVSAATETEQSSKAYSDETARRANACQQARARACHCIRACPRSCTGLAKEAFYSSSLFIIFTRSQIQEFRISHTQ